jgi:peptidoglycan/xylan/chitin deacetylase (PgdA/CDA1 family)
VQQRAWYRRGIFLLAIGFMVGVLFSRLTGGLFSEIVSPDKSGKNSDGSEYSHRTAMPTDFVKLFPKLVYREGSPKAGPAIALSFDDGPDMKYTPRILDTLKKNNVKATFFVVGTQIIKYPATFRRILSEGHEIGSHGYQHVKISEIPVAKVRYQLTKNDETILKYGGQRKVALFRPPYGALDAEAIGAIGKYGEKIALWTVDSLDWRGLKRGQVFSNVIPKARPGYIVLQHCAAESSKENLNGSVDALTDIIKAAKRNGYRFLTISQLLKEAGK